MNSTSVVLASGNVLVDFWNSVSILTMLRKFTLHTGFCKVRRRSSYGTGSTYRATKDIDSLTIDVDIYLIWYKYN